MATADTGRFFFCRVPLGSGGGCAESLVLVFSADFGRGPLRIDDRIWGSVELLACDNADFGRGPLRIDDRM